MARRTQIFQQIPWNGGINSSVDSGIIPSTDLTIADNVLFSSSGSRLKREGHSYYDTLSDIPKVISRASSGTTRTLVFAATLSSTLIDSLVVGEVITISSNSSSELIYTSNGTTILTIGTTNITNDTITYTGSGVETESITATSTLVVKRRYPIVKLVNYWRDDASNLPVQMLVGITEQPLLFKYDAQGRRKQIEADAGVTARVGTSDRVNTVIFNNRLIAGYSRIGNKPTMYRPETTEEWQDLPYAPDFSVCTTHLNRIWTNDKNNKDRLHYSGSGSHTDWNGASDSGALDIRPGDGDPEGITAIFAYKGQVFVGKKNKLYRVVGDSPENFQVLDVSNGLGVESQGSIAPIDNDDVFYISSKGVHTVATTSNYGDFLSAFLSAKIQPTFNEFSRGLLRECQAVYNPLINSVAFSFGAGSAADCNQLWLYNVITKEWYRWPDISCTALTNYDIGDRPYIFIGTSDGRIIRAQNGTYTDFGTRAIPYRIKTGTIYADGNPLSVKMFKRFNLFFRPTGAYSFVVKIKIDGFSEQELGFSQVGEGDELNQTFILGTSLLGFTDYFAPQALPIDGIGRGIIIEIEHTGTGEQVEIHGFSIEYEQADIAQETET